MLSRIFSASWWLPSLCSMVYLILWNFFVPFQQWDPLYALGASDECPGMSVTGAGYTHCLPNQARTKTAIQEPGVMKLVEGFLEKAMTHFWHMIPLMVRLVINIQHCHSGPVINYCCSLIKPDWLNTSLHSTEVWNSFGFPKEIFPFHPKKKHGLWLINKQNSLLEI